jgi:hypothetical protein
MNGIGAAVDEASMTFEDFRKAFYYGRYSDMQFKFLARMDDEPAADAVAAVFDRLGEALDTGDLAPVRQAVFEAQVAAYAGDSSPTVDDAPFSALTAELPAARLALLSAGGVFRVGDDPMGPDGPTQQKSLALIKEFLSGAPTLSVIPRDTPDAALTARHPGYDARTAQRDPGTVFPLALLRDLEDEGRVRLADQHYAFTGATSQVRLRNQVAPEWAQRFRADEVDACLLVAT